MSRKFAFPALSHTWDLQGPVSVLWYTGTLIKTCLIGYYTELRITSELGRNDAAMRKEQRRGGSQSPV
jgi:hypothetical protein